MTKKLLYIAGCVCAASLLIGAVGDAFKAVMTDASGNVVSTPLAFSNNVTLNVAPAAAAHVARMQDITNATVVTLAVTNVTGDTSILVTGTRVKALAWSNANAYVTATVTNGVPTLAGNNGFTGTNNFANTTTVTNLVINGSSTIHMPHYMAATTNTLTNPVVTNANLITWTDIAHTYRFRTVGGKIYADEVGTYEIIASVIMKATTVETVEGAVWFAVNGTNIAASATHISFPTATSGTVTNMAQVISVPTIANNTSTNDYLEVFWYGSDTSIILPHTAASTAPVRPASPAAILTIKKISGGID